MLPPEVWQDIGQYLPHKQRLHLRLVCKELADYLFPYKVTRPRGWSPLLAKVHELDLTGSKYIPTTDQLKQLVNLVSLTIDNIPHIRDVSFLTQLKSLSVKGNSGVTQECVAKLVNLTAIYFDDNLTITDLNTCHNLRIVHGSTSLTQKGIRNLTQVTELVCPYGQLTDVSHMTKLQTLIIAETKVGQDSISCLKRLHKLDCSHCPVYDLSVCPNLVSVRAVACPLTRINCPKLQELNCCGITSLYDLSHLTNLRELIARNSSIKKVPHSLEILDCSNCKSLTDIGHCHSLRVLHANYSNITQQSIYQLTRLVEIYIDGNKTINDLRHLKDLRKISATKDAALALQGVEGLTGVEITCWANKGFPMMHKIVRL